MDFWKSIVHPEDIPKVTKKLNEHLEGNTSFYECKNRLRLKSGKYRYNLDQGKVVAWDANGKPLRMAGTDTDITKRKQIEDNLKELQKRFANIFDLAEDAIISIDKNQNIQLFNQGAEKTFGYKAQEVIGKSISLLIPKRFREIHAQHIQSFSESSISSKAMNYRAAIFALCKDGKEFPAEATISQFALHREKTFTVILRDITKRKLAEDALQKAYQEMEMQVKERTSELQQEKDFAESLILTAHVIILVLDTNGYIMRFNPYMEEISGYSLQEVQNKDWFAIFTPEKDQEQARKVFLKTMDNVPIYGNINPIIRKDGEIIEIEWFAKSLKDVRGKIIGIIAVGQDITLRKQAEKVLYKIEQLESLGVLAGGIAHDFNNLLVSVICNINLAKRYLETNNKAYKRLAEAEKASSQAKKLTQQLLTFSKGGAPIKETTSLVELIQDASEFAVVGSNTKIEYSIPDNLWLAEVDKGQIGQVIYNLAINAVQAMPLSGVIKIKVENATILSSDMLLKAGNYVKIIIEDQGAGIPEEHISKIFNPYFTSKKRGSGLGLAVTYSIVQKHSGLIHVDSKVGKGTIFHIYLPASDKKQFAQDKSKQDIVSGTGKILLMDDDQQVRNTIKIALEDIGYKVICAKEGNEAIALYHRKSKRIFRTNI